MSRLAHAAAMTLLAGLLGACVGTETGNPPVIDPALDGARVLLREDAVMGELVLEAGAGAVDPPTAALRIIDLEATSDFVMGAVEPDGSAAISFEGDGDHWFRVEAILGEGRSRPVDVQVLSVGAPAPCLTLAGETTVELEDVGRDTPAPIAVGVANRCGDVSIEIVGALRLPDSSYALAPAGTLTLAPLESNDTAFVVTLRAAAPGLHEDILVVSADTGELRAVSFRARVR